MEGTRTASRSNHVRSTFVGTLYSSATHFTRTYFLRTVNLRLCGLSSWQLDPHLANVLRMGWAEAHTQRPPFTTILEEVTAHHQQACNHLLYSALLATGKVRAAHRYYKCTALVHARCMYILTERVHLHHRPFLRPFHRNESACS